MPTLDHDMPNEPQHHAAHSSMRRGLVSGLAPVAAPIMILLAVCAWLAGRSVITSTLLFEIGSVATATLPPLLAMLFSVGVAHRREISSRDRTGWVFAALSSGCMTAFVLIALISPVMHLGAAITNAAMFLQLGMLLFAAIALLHWVPRINASSTIGSLMDLMFIAMIAYVVSWKTLLAPALLGTVADHSVVDRIVSLSSLALSLFVLVAVTAMLSQVGRQAHRGIEMLATFGFVAIVASTMMLNLNAAKGIGFIPAWTDAAAALGSARVADAGFAIGFCLVALSASVRRRATIEGGIPIVERSALWELVVALIPFGLLGGALWVWTSGSADSPQQRVILGTISALLLGRCALVTVSSIRSARGSTVDRLTGALNHREFQEQLPIFVEDSLTACETLSVALIDLDNLGMLNESLSHAEGDHFLRDVGWMLRSMSADHHVTFRVGGNEFAILMPRTDPRDAVKLMERIADASLQLRPTLPIAPTLRIGVSSTPVDSLDASELVQLAGGALYWSRLTNGSPVTRYDADVVKVLNESERFDELEQRVRLRAVVALARALDTRDAYTARHSENVATYAVAIARECGWDATQLDDMRTAGLLHDVGKIGVRDSTLRKASNLTDEEWNEMRQHPELGARMIADVAPELVVSWVLAHHERIDGRGYPNRLQGNSIPFGARVLAVADTFDAMTSSRSYRPAMSCMRAINTIVDCAGAQFDPEIVAAFMRALKSSAIDVHKIEQTRAQQRAHELKIDDDVQDDEAAITDSEFLPIENSDSRADAA